MKFFQFLLFSIFILLANSCQQAKQEKFWKETENLQISIQKELSKANQLDQQLVQLINENANASRRETYLSLLQSLKQLENSLLEWQDSLKTPETLRAVQNHRAVMDYLRQEKQMGDSLNIKLAEEISRAQKILSDAN